MSAHFEIAAGEELSVLELYERIDIGWVKGLVGQGWWQGLCGVTVRTPRSS